MKKKAMAFVLSLALTVGLCPGTALATDGADASGLSAAQVTSTISTQATTKQIVDKAVKACNALPSPSKIKLTDNAKLRTALQALADAASCPESDFTSDMVSKLNKALDKYVAAHEAMEKLIKSETTKTKSKKVAGVKAVAGKKSAAVSWKKLGSNYKYEVYYSAKKNSGFKKAATTKNTKATVSKLAKGKKYYFKVRGVRTDIPKKAAAAAYKTVYTKYSGVAVSGAVK